MANANPRELKGVKLSAKRGLTQGTVKVYSNQTLKPDVTFDITKVGTGFLDSFDVTQQSEWIPSTDVQNYPWETTLTVATNTSKPWPIGDNYDIIVELKDYHGSGVVDALFHVILDGSDPTYVITSQPVELTFA